ncbi:MAG TPA: molybdate ABC transporter substrate-binding protein [Candidatus Aquilonibacter sp.]|nr:molybdate ABC transporter substrate-binding protein [Candidatus Aquilonibacter sp.]
MRRALFTAVVVAVFAPILHAQKQLQLACAADLEPVIPTLAAEYQRATGVHLVTSFGSSATLAQQLSNGAPQDVFLSADTAHPQQLVAAGVALGPVTPYAHGVLVLWARNDSPLQPISLNTLKSPRLTRLAIANPTHAPYGLAAQQALQHMGLYTQLQTKLAIAENIGQTAQFAESGNAQAGLISLTIASSAHFRQLGRFVPIPPDAYSPIQQAGVILKSSQHQQLARQFLDWLTSPAIQHQLHSFGLDPAR